MTFCSWCFNIKLWFPVQPLMERKNRDGVDMDIKSLDGFVVGILLLNTSEALTSWWELHQAPLCSLSWVLSGRGIVPPRAVKCKCNNLPGRLPGKLNMFILLLNLACLPSLCNTSSCQWPFRLMDVPPTKEKSCPWCLPMAFHRFFFTVV